MRKKIKKGNKMTNKKIKQKRKNEGKKRRGRARKWTKMEKDKKDEERTT